MARTCPLATLSPRRTYTLSSSPATGLLRSIAWVGSIRQSNEADHAGTQTSSDTPAMTCVFRTRFSCLVSLSGERGADERRPFTPRAPTASARLVRLKRKYHTTIGCGLNHYCQRRPQLGRHQFADVQSRRFIPLL